MGMHGHNGTRDTRLERDEQLRNGRDKGTGEEEVELKRLDADGLTVFDVADDALSEAEGDALLNDDNAREQLTSGHAPAPPILASESIQRATTQLDRVLAPALGHMTASERRAFLMEMLTQIFPIQLVSLAGSVFTGMLLDRLQSWNVFVRVEELFILIPILLNLKGNLEMNLAARFSTSANIGELDLRRTRNALVLGNMALLQVQALIVSFVSGLVAFALGMASRNGIKHSLQHPVYKPGHPGNVAAGGQQAANALRGSYFEAAMLLCVGMLAASMSSIILGSFVCATVIFARAIRVNPDNISTPLAGALGDLVTLVLIAVLSWSFVGAMGTFLSTIIIGLLILAVGCNVIFTLRNVYVQELLGVGWTPLLLAMIVSSGTGIILERFVDEFRGYGLVATAFCAISGSSATVFAARLSTTLHGAGSKREHPLTTAIALSSMAFVTLSLFLIFVWITNQANVTLVFALSYAIVIVIQTSIVMGMTKALVDWLWRKDYDPDVYALPIITAVSDLTGQSLLVGAFSLARFFSSSKTAPSPIPTDDVTAVLFNLSR